MTHPASGLRAQSAPVKTIGFLVDWIDDAYQNQILDGVRDAARDRRIQLLCFAGGVLNSELRGGARRNATFDLVNAENVDGLILMSGTLGNQIGASELLAYSERFGKLPRVSVAAPLPGMASVVVDNRTGIESAITHLIRSADLPRWLLDSGVSGAFYVATLFSGERVLGYALIDLGAREGVVYEALREFLSAAVRSIVLNARSRQTDAPPAASSGDSPPHPLM